MNCNTTSKSRNRNLNGLIAPTLSTLFNDILNGQMKNTEHSKFSNTPAVNIDKSDDTYILNFALPGVKKEDININVEDRKLTVSSQTDADEKTYRLREFNFNSFSRVFTLPKNIVSADIAADYKDGILALTLPTAPETQPKSIKIN